MRFTFNDQSDREFPLIIALTPIIPKHAFNKDTFDQTTLKPLVGSGPYTVAQVAPGQRIVFKRNPDYWGKDIPSKRGLRQFRPDHHRIFPERQCPARGVQERHLRRQHRERPGQARARHGLSAFKRGDVVAETFKTGIPPVVTGFLFNTRLAKFSNPEVRRALGMLYDFEWANKNLFNGRYTRTMSYWQGSELSALGHPASDKEKALLAPFPGRVPPDVMDGSWRPPRH